MKMKFYEKVNYEEKSFDVYIYSLYIYIYTYIYHAYAVAQHEQLVSPPTP